MLQCHPADDALKRLEDKPSSASVEAVKTYKFNSKKTSITAWQTVLKNVKTQENYWNSIRDHVMLGENTIPQKGFHSKRLEDSANSIAVGKKNPENVGKSSPYKQWHKNKNDQKNKLKISTFFPDNWPESKIKAAILLNSAGSEHQVKASFELTSNDGTTYPTTNLADP